MKQFIALILMLSMSVNAVAMTVFDPTVFAQLVKQLAQAEQQLHLLQRQLDALKQLKSSQYQWSDVQPLMQTLNQTMEKTNAIAYSSKQLDSQFKANFPGYEPTNNYQTAYQDSVNTTLQTLNNTLQTAQQQANHFEQEQHQLQFWQSQVQQAQGPTQAIQAAAQITAAQMGQMQLLRQALFAQTQAQSVYYAQSLQQEASREANMTHLISAGQTTAKPFASFTSLEVPTF